MLYMLYKYEYIDFYDSGYGHIIKFNLKNENKLNIKYPLILTYSALLLH